MADTNFFEWLYADIDTLIDCDFSEENETEEKALKEREGK